MPSFQNINFALNHICTPNLSFRNFFALAEKLGLCGVEIRNDIGKQSFPGFADPQSVRKEAEKRNLRILSINALQRFNEWNAEREKEAKALADFAASCGAEALVLVPTNDGSGCADGERQKNLGNALKALTPILNDRGIAGLVEPLGFQQCSLRFKSEAVDAIQTTDTGNTFKLVHDTFHHHLAGENILFPAETGLVHISGVIDPALTTTEMLDEHRVLVDSNDRLDNIGQLQALLQGGVNAAFSFEPFAEEIHTLEDHYTVLKRSLTFIESSFLKFAA